MTLRLPGLIEARLVDGSGRPLREADVLISIRTFADGEYYYGNLVGLTNGLGIAAISRDEIELRFAADRVDYPMDYKLDLDASDPDVEVAMMQPAYVAEVRETGGALAPAIREAYERARNDEFAPASARVWADLPGERSLVVSLATRRLPSG